MIKTDILVSEKVEDLGRMFDERNKNESDEAWARGSEYVDFWQISGPISYVDGKFMMPIRKGF
jgi:hypothetical protein